MLWKMGFSSAKIAPSPPYTPPGTIETRKGFCSTIWHGRSASSFRHSAALLCDRLSSFLLYHVFARGAIPRGFEASSAAGVGSAFFHKGRRAYARLPLPVAHTYSWRATVQRPKTSPPMALASRMSEVGISSNDCISCCSR